MVYQVSTITIIYFKFFFNFKFPIIMFYIFVLGSNYLLLYRVYLAKVDCKGWSLWNSFTREGALVLIYL